MCSGVIWGLVDKDLDLSIVVGVEDADLDTSELVADPVGMVVDN